MTLELTINLSGEGFKPSLLKQYIKDIEVLAETGEISSKGLYKNEISPYGMCYYTVYLSKKAISDEIKKQCSFLDKLPLDELHITDVEFLVFPDERDGWKELYLSADALSCLANLEANIEIL